MSDTAQPEPWLDVPCLACCAKPGERCATILTGSYRDAPHAQRVQRSNEQRAGERAEGDPT